jgi:general secretion pathway protein C
MLQYLRWAVNSALFVGCCFLTANIANSIVAAALTPAATASANEAVSPSSASKRSWEDREVILTRNLFNSSTLAAQVETEIISEELEATKLPLTLLGTAAATNDLYSWAAIKDRDSSDTKVVRIGDEIRPTAIIMRIERRRVVLDENGLPRELVLKEKNASKAYSSASRRTPTRSKRRTSSSRRRTPSSRRPPSPSTLQTLGKDHFGISRGDLDETMIDPSIILNQARFMPKFEGGQMIGLQVNDPRPGSLFEQAGIKNGDVITEINGVKINSAEQSRKVLSAFEGSDKIDIVVKQNGTIVTKTISVSP